MAKDLEAVINSAVDNAMESGDLPPDESYSEGEPVEETTDATETTETVETTDSTVAAGTQTRTEEVDALMEEIVKETGFKPRKGSKDNPIPYSNVQKIIGNREKRAVESVAKAIGVDATTLKFEGLEAAISEKMKGFEGFEEERENYSRAEQIMTNDSERYLRILATVEPEKYSAATLRRVADALEGKAKTTATKSTESSELEDFDVDLPEPDYDLGNGAKTYTPQGLQAAIKAAVVQAVEYGRKTARQEAENVFKPIKDQSEQAQREHEREQASQAKLASVLKWKGMDDEEKFGKVMAALKADTAQATVRGKLDRNRLKYKTVEDAYIELMPTFFAEDDAVREQKIREKLIVESKGRKSSTAVGKGVQVKAKVDGESSGDPIIDAINRSLDRAGL